MENKVLSVEKLLALPYTGRTMSNNPIMDEHGENAELLRDEKTIAQLRCLFSYKDSQVRTHDTSLAILEGDVIKRRLPNGDTPTYRVTKSTYSQGMQSRIPSHGLAASYVLLIEKTTAIDTRPAPVTNNYQNVGVVHHGTGAVNGVVQNINSAFADITQTLSSSPHIAEESKGQLTQLFAELQKALKQVPIENAEDAEAIADLAKEVVDKANKEKPNPLALSISAKGLKEAAQTLATVSPAVLMAATQIASLLSGSPT